MIKEIKCIIVCEIWETEETSEAKKNMQEIVRRREGEYYFTQEHDI